MQSLLDSFTSTPKTPIEAEVRAAEDKAYRNVLESHGLDTLGLFITSVDRMAEESEGDDGSAPPTIPEDGPAPEDGPCLPPRRLSLSHEGQRRTAVRVSALSERRPGPRANYRDGARLAKMGMKAEAARAILCGTGKDGATCQPLVDGFHSMVLDAKCQRTIFAYDPPPCAPPCPRAIQRARATVRLPRLSDTCPECGGAVRAPGSDESRRRRADAEAMLDGLDVGDLLPSADDDAGRHERAEVAALLRKHHAAIRGVHTYYSNAGDVDKTERGLASAFTMDRHELRVFIDDCKLMGGKLTATRLSLLFIRVNWEGPAGERPAPGTARATDDGATVLNLGAFTCMLLRLAALKADDGVPLSIAFDRVMEDAVLPNAKQDVQDYLREALAGRAELRLVAYMYRSLLRATFEMYSLDEPPPPDEAARLIAEAAEANASSRRSSGSGHLLSERSRRNSGSLSERSGGLSERSRRDSGARSYAPPRVMPLAGFIRLLSARGVMESAEVTRGIAQLQLGEATLIFTQSIDEDCEVDASRVYEQARRE